MNTEKLTLGIVIALALAVIGYFFVLGGAMIPAAPPAEEVQPYASEDAGLSFTYPLGYFLMEREAGTAERPQKAIILTEDTEENRAVLLGSTTVASEGPTAITIDIYPNPEMLAAEDWIRSDTNWTIRTSDLAPAVVGTEAGVTYTWSGLYEGRSTIVTKGDKAYVFSVTWMDPTDPILADYEALLRGVVLH